MRRLLVLTRSFYAHIPTVSQQRRAKSSHSDLTASSDSSPWHRASVARRPHSVGRLPNYAAHTVSSKIRSGRSRQSRRAAAKGASKSSIGIGVATAVDDDDDDDEPPVVCSRFRKSSFRASVDLFRHLTRRDQLSVLANDRPHFLHHLAF